MSPMTREAVLAWLAAEAEPANVAGMARYGIVSEKVYGVPLSKLRPLARRIGRDHALAAALWAEGAHETRLLAALIDDPQAVTAEQMDAWAAEFDNWAVCDGACCDLFDRTPLAWEAIPRWAEDDRLFVKRAAFALIAGLAAHDKRAEDPRFIALLPLIERGAVDPRDLARKAVSWALRGIGKRNLALNAAARETAEWLAGSPERAAAWVGRDAARELGSAKVRERLARMAQRPAP